MKNMTFAEQQFAKKQETKSGMFMTGLAFIVIATVMYMVVKHIG